MESLGQRAPNNLTVLCQQVRAPGSLGAFKKSCEWSPVDSGDLASSLSRGVPNGTLSWGSGRRGCPSLLDSVLPVLIPVLCQAHGTDGKQRVPRGGVTACSCPASSIGAMVPAWASPLGLQDPSSWLDTSWVLSLLAPLKDINVPPRTFFWQVSESRLGFLGTHWVQFFGPSSCTPIGLFLFPFIVFHLFASSLCKSILVFTKFGLVDF